MKKPLADPIISELWAVRDAHAARFNYDVAAILKDVRATQKKLGPEYVRHPARPTVSSSEVLEAIHWHHQRRLIGTSEPEGESPPRKAG